MLWGDLLSCLGGPAVCWSPGPCLSEPVHAVLQVSPIGMPADSASIVPIENVFKSRRLSLFDRAEACPHLDASNTRAALHVKDRTVKTGSANRAWGAGVAAFQFELSRNLAVKLAATAKCDSVEGLNFVVEEAEDPGRR